MVGVVTIKEATEAEAVARSVAMLRLVAKVLVLTVDKVFKVAPEPMGKQPKVIPHPVILGGLPIKTIQTENENEETIS